MRNGSALLKSIFGFPALALVGIAFFSSCQKTSVISTANIGDWSKITVFPGQPRTQAVSFTIGDTAYIGGGYNGVTGLRLQDFYKFDESHNQSWINVAPFPGDARSGAVGFSANGNGYIVGGYDGTNYLYDVWQYSPSTNAWTRMKDITVTAPEYVSTIGAIGLTFGGQFGQFGYIGGGSDSTSYTHEEFYQYDANTDTWAQKADIGAKIVGAGAFVYGGTGYVVAGAEETGPGGPSSYSPDLFAYNPSLDQWVKRRHIINDGDSSYEADYGTNITRSNSAVLLINDTAYLATGNFNGIIGTTWAYDIGNDQWFQKTSFEGTARESAIGFSVNNHGYIATGDNGSNYYDDVWQWFPDDAQTNNDNY
jgi:N-acetylneuraminic acid mutarotase